VIILDTNVVSELMANQPHPAVLSLLDSRAAESIWTTSITIFEIRVGIELLPASRRKQQLENGFRRALDLTLQNRVLVFDEEAALAAAALSADRRRRGTPIETRDTMIAGIAVARKGELVTRNVRHFGDVGFPIINPWGQ
jgi:predicted nucleic acid-binding protein